MACVAAEYAREALSLDDGCWQAHQWYATAVGSMSKFQGTQQKIEQGFEYKVTCLYNRGHSVH